MTSYLAVILILFAGGSGQMTAREPTKTLTECLAMLVQGVAIVKSNPPPDLIRVKAFCRKIKTPVEPTTDPAA
jgi:hypothetical protein